MRAASLLLLSLALALGCGDDDDTGVTPMDAGTDAGPSGPSLRDEATPVVFSEVYSAVSYTEGGFDREYLPIDLAVHPDGELWVVQRMERDPAFDDDTECTTAGLSGAPNDCVSQQGTTVGISDPAADEPATAENGRASLVMDANAWHFMRRPAAIAFGAEELVLHPDDPGAEGADLTEPITYVDTFATCHEHWTGNTTDQPPFIGPTLWTADPEVYNGMNGSFEWSNGSHLDMVHGTQYCMGIAYERENIYWVHNGAGGVIDRYDFGAPHHAGHHDHEDANVERYLMPVGDELVRVPNVPSNMLIDGETLWIADTGNGRVLRFDLSSPVVRFGTFTTSDGYPGESFEGLTYGAVLDAPTLEAEWGGPALPSGLAMLPDGTMVVASHDTGHLTLFDADGTVVRTIDTGLGAGLGGVTVLGGDVYFVQMTERRVYRVDLVE